MKTRLTFDEVYGSGAVPMIVAHDNAVQRIPEMEQSSLPWLMGVFGSMSDEERERVAREFKRSYHGGASGSLVLIRDLHHVPTRIGFARLDDKE